MTDQPIGKLEEQPDFGTMAFGLLDPQAEDVADCDMTCFPGVEYSNPGNIVLALLTSQSRARLNSISVGRFEDWSPVCGDP